MDSSLMDSALMDSSLMDSALMITENAILLGVALASGVVTIVLLVAYLLEANRLKKALKQVSETGVIPPRIELNDPLLSMSWDLVKSQRFQFLNLGYAAKERYQLASFGADLLRRNTSHQQTSKTLLDVIFERASSDLVGAAVILKNSKDGSRIDACRGVPQKRIEEALLTCADILLDEAELLDKKYFDHSIDPCFDFRSFSIGRSLFYPIHGDSETGGLLWVGLRQGQLSSVSFELIDGLVNYAAASFQSVIEIEKTVEGKNSERDFLLGLSHDLRSPGNRALFSIRDLLHSPEVSEEQVERLKCAEDSILEQLRMLGNVLDLAKHDSGLLDPNPSKVLMRDFLQKVSQRFKPEYENKGLQLECRCSLPIAVWADQEHLFRIFNNLLSNAVKFTDAGGVIVEAKVEASTAVISFLDTGDGIPELERNSLFERFDQGVGGKRKGGVGLGLFLSKALAERNDGQLYYLQPPFGGSKFVLELPYLAVSQQPLAYTPPVAQYGTVLLVEDDLPTARMLMRYLESSSLRAFHATTVADAEQKLRELQPSLVVSDFNFDGRPALPFLASIPDQIPLIIVSGESKEWLEKRFSRHGALSILEKPIERSQLKLEIENLTRQSLSGRRVVGQ